MDGLSDAAVVVTACCRPGYFRRVLQSWEQARHARHVRGFLIALGRSERQDEMLALAGQSSLALKVRLDSDAAARSPGMHRALGEAIDSVFADPRVQFAVCGEEDIIVSDDVLEYLAWARQHMTGDVLAACAHNRGGTGWDDLAAGPRDDGASQETVRRAAYFNAWVWGITRDRWAQVIRPAWDWDCTSGGVSESGYDWQMQRITSQGWVNLVPDAARSQNIGEHGGTYSTPVIFPLQLSRSFREHREPPVTYRLEGAELWSVLRL